MPSGSPNLGTLPAVAPNPLATVTTEPAPSPTPAPSAAPAGVAPGVATIVASPPNDPYFPQQWALHNDGTQTVTIDADPLHTVLQPGLAGVDVGWEEAATDVQAATSPVIVAVIDSGIDPSHPDLQNR